MNTSLVLGFEPDSDVVPGKLGKRIEKSLLEKKQRKQTAKATFQDKGIEWKEKSITITKDLVFVQDFIRFVVIALL